MKKIIVAFGGLLIMVAVVGYALTKSDNKQSVDTVDTKGNYVALGDSVAAGIGLDGDSDASACDRTNQSYPDLVASKLNYKLKNIACSGATLPAGILGQQDVNKLMVAPQIQQLFAMPKPDLVTMTIGANDAQWSTVFAKCYTAVCGSAADTAAVAASLKTVNTNVRDFMAQVKSHYGDAPPRIIVTGYHQVFPVTPTTGCSDLTGVDANELVWGRQLQAYTNDALKRALAGFDFASFVPVDFSGHELCSAEPWVQGLTDKQPYHPTADGQAAFAKAIETAAKAMR